MDELDMAYHGTLRDELDIKVLMLFILRRLPGSLKGEVLSDLCLEYGRIGYFEYTVYLSELIDAKLVEANGDNYRITEKGDKNCAVVESGLPYSTRMHLEKALKPMADAMRRDNMIGTGHTVGENGCQVELKLNDGMGEILNLRILCAGEEQARKMESLFRKRAESTYHKIIELLNEE